MNRGAVIGGGTMGLGIAYVMAQAGAEVCVVEPDEGRANQMWKAIGDAADGAVRRGKMSADQAADLTARVTRVTAVDALADGLDLIVESVPERFDLKRAVLDSAAERNPAVLATNTSAMSIDRLADGLPAPDRFIGMHFFNPVWSLKLVELVQGNATSDATIAAARTIAAWMGKEALLVRDVPGFATSRLDLIASLEAMRMLESGVASAEDIDRAAVLAYRHPVGPLRLSDIVGLDVRLDIARTLEAAHGARFAPPAILEKMVSEGKLGAKSGQGFFTWPEA
ncbi:3-hydroxyacyl-CoA dehydrogenase NAD-binding domain-containing protein [Tsuneonella sp. YG55]|uniref:3-hydroxyacyl-CoA dehydrogenase NAD-binding domain-containing protein n=1 Tax=Tsuneonella litorea TaxID=2976475 RepID=A0A9X2W217_9SPHN|nr:3-hydroxyacyl-CoA dehydrogenase NAD-binding domain-containing protein [Tsuneonella litorea]MCT2559568.1 3-hydroxyacyl-CoA dehydrogenase NAD-binding domain-containing protein [Tsuneonella litorea]